MQFDSPPRFPDVPAAYRALFAQQLDDDIFKLERIRNAGDLHAMNSWLHRLSGALAIFGPSMLLASCKALHRSMQPESSLDLLREELVALRDALR